MSNNKYTIVYLGLLCKPSYNISLLNIFTIVNKYMKESKNRLKLIIRD